MKDPPTDRLSQRTGKESGEKGTNREVGFVGNVKPFLITAMANLAPFSIKTEDPDNLYQIYTTHAGAGSAGHKLTKINFVCWFALVLKMKHVKK